MNFRSAQARNISATESPPRLREGGRLAVSIATRPDRQPSSTNTLPPIPTAAGIIGLVWFRGNPFSAHTPSSGRRPWTKVGTADAPHRTACSLLTIPRRRIPLTARHLSTRVPPPWRPVEVTFSAIFPPRSLGGEVQDTRTRILPSSNELAYGRGRILCLSSTSRMLSTDTRLAALTAGPEISISVCRAAAVTA